MNRPKVSIITIAYNHEKYIAKALDSFVEQKTDFDYEVIVADDHSSDKTKEIIREYVEKYPQIHAVLRKQNIGAQKNFFDALSRAEGDYIALCEGDDFWTDPQKLQLQADFLDNNSEYSMCFHPVRVFFEGGEEVDTVYPETDDPSQFTVEELLKGNFIQTNSVMYRRQDYRNMPEDILPLDWYLHLYHACFGKIGFINRTMSAYRRHANGLWWDSYNQIEQIWKKHGIAHMGMYAATLDLFSDCPEYKRIISRHISDAFSWLAKASHISQEQTMREIICRYPVAVEASIEDLQFQISENVKLIDDKTRLLGEKDFEIKELRRHLNSIHDSKGWRYLTAYRKYKKFFKKMTRLS